MGLQLKLRLNSCLIKNLLDSIALIGKSCSEINTLEVSSIYLFSCSNVRILLLIVRSMRLLMKLPLDVMLDTIIKTASADLSVEIMRLRRESFVISDSRIQVLLLVVNLFVMIFVKNYWKNMNF